MRIKMELTVDTENDEKLTRVIERWWSAQGRSSL